jgi:hypothetical protein
MPQTSARNPASQTGGHSRCRIRVLLQSCRIVRAGAVNATAFACGQLQRHSPAGNCNGIRLRMPLEPLRQSVQLAGQKRSPL